MLLGLLDPQFDYLAAQLEKVIRRIKSTKNSNF